jgi:hypothetical protein
MREEMTRSRSAGDGDPRPEWQRRAAQRFAAALALIVLGSAIVMAADGDIAAVGWGISGLGLTLATIFLFLEIGLSEDRDRASGGQGPPRGF